MTFSYIFKKDKRDDIIRKLPERTARDTESALITVTHPSSEDEKVMADKRGTSPLFQLRYNLKT